MLYYSWTLSLPRGAHTYVDLYVCAMIVCPDDQSFIYFRYCKCFQIFALYRFSFLHDTTGFMQSGNIKITKSLESQGKEVNWKKMLCLVKESQGIFLPKYLTWELKITVTRNLIFQQQYKFFLLLGCRYMMLEYNIL